MGMPRLSREDMFERISCPLCGAEGGKTIFCIKETLLYKNLPENLSFNVVCCEGCGLQYVNPRLKKDILDSIYSKDLYDSYGVNYNYKPKVNLRYDIHHDNLDQRLKSFSHFIDVLQKHITSGSALEVGFSFGYLLNMLREKDFDVAGVELSRYVFEFARDTFGFENLWLGDFLDVDFQGRRFDLIVLWHVFEHVHKPREILERCGELLSDNGLIMVTCPFHHQLEEKHINPVEHLYYFQQEQVSRFIESAFNCRTWVENPFVFGQKIA